jgi:hypothetical protein
VVKHFDDKIFRCTSYEGIAFLLCLGDLEYNPFNPVFTMGPISYLLSLYDLDTIDTRFTTPSTVPYKAIIEDRGHSRRKTESLEKTDKKTKPSKWGTPEFFLYYLIFIVTVPYMFFVVYDVSTRMYPGAVLKSHLLIQGSVRP